MEVEDPLSIDAKEIAQPFWLKGQITKQVDPDPNNSQKLAEEILQILEEDTDERLAENRLVELLQYGKFDFAKMLLKNRLKIVYLTKLAHAEDDTKKAKIEDEMRNDLRLAPILEQLHRTGSKKQQLENMKKEARSLKARSREKDGGADRAGKLIDLQELAFQQGSHLMSNKNTTLPPGSYRVSKKGYEEIHIPALKQPPLEDNEALVRIADMPEWAHKGFEGMVTLNRIQSRLFKAAFLGHENILLCAPTGAGKTNVAMLTVLHEVGLNINAEGELDLDNFKIVYIAPMKALVQETVGNFTKRLSGYGIKVGELTGDQNMTKQQIKETQIIVTTPEKWDIITRKAGDRTFLQQVKLIIIDEIHLLHDDRGPVLESIVARTIRQIETTQDMIRLVGLSATLPGYEDVARFLRVKDDFLFAFNNSYRPVPLEQQFIGLTEKKGTYLIM